MSLLRDFPITPAVVWRLVTESGVVHHSRKDWCCWCNAVMWIELFDVCAEFFASDLPQPGVASVQCAILQKAPGSVSFYMRQFDNFEGLEYEDVRRRFSGAVVCGFLRQKSFSPVLNPAADEKLEKGDRVVVLAPRGQPHALQDTTVTVPWKDRRGQHC